MTEEKLKSPYVVAIIEKDAAEHLPKVVPLHEVPVLEFVHRERTVTIDENADLPNGLVEKEFDPEEEYDRLVAYYGTDPETKQPYAQAVYGSLDGFTAAVSKQHDTAPPRARRKRA